MTGLKLSAKFFNPSPAVKIPVPPMKCSLFSRNSPGHLVKIDKVETDSLAFVPDELPPGWKFPEALWPILAEAKRQVGILDGLGRTLPSPGILLRPLEDREAIKSSQLEGTYATARELLLFEIQPREASRGDMGNDPREVYNYRLALHHIVNSQLPLSLRLIKQLHDILLAGVRCREKMPGEFRTVQVAIGSSRRFIPPPPHLVLPCLHPLEGYFHKPSSRFDALVNCFLVHYQFETIHPFVDGNGRVGRVVLAHMLQQACELSKPWLYMSEYFEPRKDEYIERLFNVSAKDDWEGWIGFCLNGVVSQAKDTIIRCERLRRIREQFMGRLAEVGGPVRLAQIVEGIFTSPFVRVADLQKKLDVTYPTAKADIDRLVNAGILEALPNLSPKTFYAPEVFAIAYEAV